MFGLAYNLWYLNKNADNMNHISRRTSRFYDIYDYDQFIFRVDFYYNGQSNSKKQNQGNDSDNLADTQNGSETDNNHDDGPKRHNILRLFSTTDIGTGATRKTEFTYYSIFITEG